MQRFIDEALFWNWRVPLIRISDRIIKPLKRDEQQPKFTGEPKSAKKMVDRSDTPLIQKHPDKKIQ
jgi:hypothetical protein